MTGEEVLSKIKKLDLNLPHILTIPLLLYYYIIIYPYGKSQELKCIV